MESHRLERLQQASRATKPLKRGPSRAKRGGQQHRLRGRHSFGMSCSDTLCSTKVLLVFNRQDNPVDCLCSSLLRLERRTSETVVPQESTANGCWIALDEPPNTMMRDLMLLYGDSVDHYFLRLGIPCGWSGSDANLIVQRALTSLLGKAII